MKTEIELLKVGDKVCRKKEPEQAGVIISIDQYNKAKVKWDKVNDTEYSYKRNGVIVTQKTGQQHSTIDVKVLQLA